MIRSHCRVTLHCSQWLVHAKESTKICSAMIVNYCWALWCWLKASVAEESDSASNYPGMLLCAVLALMILQAVGADLAAPSPAVILHCNNHGVLLHGNNPLLLLPQKQKQANLIRLIKFLSSTNSCKLTWWGCVKGHALERKGWAHCPLPERLNN